jgi:hypothetical protein
MTERERIIEIIMNGCKPLISPTQAGRAADALLANGVIVLPCKVGDTIYRRGDPIKKIYEWEVEHIEIYADEIVFIDDSDNKFTISDIGKTVFLSREDAEKEE